MNPRSTTLAGYVDQATAAEAPIDELLQLRLILKREEDDLVARRRAVDAAIIGYVRAQHADKQEGDLTIALDGYKLTVSIGETRKVDTPKLQAVFGDMPGNVQAAFRWKAEVALAEYRKLSELERGWLADMITTTPTSPTLSIKAVA